MGPTVVLIGPIAAGKSTVGAVLSELLGVPQVSMDDVRWAYFAELGYDRAEAERQSLQGRTVAEKLAYGKPYEVHSIERVLADRPGFVIDLGASNSVYDDDAQFERVRRAMTDARVVLVLPLPDVDASSVVLMERLRAIVHAKGEELSQQLLDFDDYFLRHPSNQRLADLAVYTEGRSPRAVAEEIVAWLGPGASGLDGRARADEDRR